MKNNIKIIFHIDLNTFFCSCAMINEPYLKDKVFAVGGSGVTRKGVISTASYKARAYGIGSAMNLNDAFKLYPKLVVVPSDFKLYHKYSKLFFKYLRSISDLVLPASIDEAYVDVTKLAETKHPLQIAKEIQDGLMNLYQLPCSIGIAPTLFLAKMASDMQKPLGITVIRKKDIVQKLLPLPMKEMYGIGKKTYPKLEEMGIVKIGDFIKKENKVKILNIMSLQSYESYVDHILGRSNDIVDPNKYSVHQSMSNETTLNYVMDELEAIIKIVDELIDMTYQRLVKEEYVVKTVGIKLKYQDFKIMTRSYSFNTYHDDFIKIKDQIHELFDLYYQGEP
ncbi:MAG: hypothetical protein WCR19_04460, partial [Acholeplasmataceae bacterium]